MQAGAMMLDPAIARAGMEAHSPATPLRDLTSGLARGDDRAWAEFHRIYGPGMFRQLLAATRGDHDLASEALQHAYLRIARHARPCDSEPMFAGWLRTVGRSALHDCWRRRRTFWELLRRSGSPCEMEDRDENAAHALTQALDHALQQLEASDRLLLEAKYYSGLDVRTLAQQRAITPKALESRLTRARLALRQFLLERLKHHD
jgi:RNA polymerase sigma factor (sigma-70 family)